MRKKALAKKKIVTLHPEGKRGVSIALDRYEIVRSAILKALEGPVLKKPYKMGEQQRLKP